MLRCVAFLIAGVFVFTARVDAQESPYFVTYSHHMEEPGSLEIEGKLTSGQPDGGNRFVGFPFEFEYGTLAWWTSEFYFEGQTTATESTVFTGFRIENRFRPLLEEHRINPVFYIEFEDINGANKSILEVVGHDGQSDFTGSNTETRAEKKREVELKLILSSNAKGWNFSENFIAEKNVTHAPWEFGYALAASRPLRLAGGTSTSAFAAQNFAAGVEMYGGLGDTDSLTLGDTSHYIGPAVNWSIPGGPRITASPNFGLTDSSLPHIYRLGVAYEIGQISRFFRSHKEETP
jgi:hypothetical protein